MSTKHDEFKVYYFSFDEDELRRVVSALRVNGDDELADEIMEEIYDGCGDCDCDESDTIGNLTIDIDTSGISEARTDIEGLVEVARGLQEVIEKLEIGNVRFRGEWLSDIVGAIADEAYKESGIKIEVAR